MIKLKKLKIGQTVTARLLDVYAFSNKQDLKEFLTMARKYDWIADAKEYHYPHEEIFEVRIHPNKKRRTRLAEMCQQLEGAMSRVIAAKRTPEEMLDYFRENLQDFKKELKDKKKEVIIKTKTLNKMRKDGGEFEANWFASKEVRPLNDRIADLEKLLKHLKTKGIK